MKNNLCYEAETTNRSAYIIFSYFMGGAILYVLIYSYFKNTEKTELFYSLGVLTVFALFVYFVLYLSDRNKDKIRKEYKYIKDNGRKIEGNIIKTNTHRVRCCDDINTYYTVTVEYKNPIDNSIATYETPYLSFNAYKELGSKKCSVYVLEDKLYVTDFIAKTEGMDSICEMEEQSKNPEEYKELKELEKKELKKVRRILLIFFIISALIVYFALIRNI